MSYNYMDAMVEDIKDYIEDEVELSDYTDLEDFRDKLNDDLWVDDGVTGNASGSYTFNSWKAKEYVIDNMDLVAEMADEFGVDNATLGEKFREGAWEYFDVSIRCYLLGQAIEQALEELDITEDSFSEEEEEEDEEE